ncbi:hypothetical protein M9C81_02665 [SAR86 cluster bacterium]|nr:hypothetical protein M9C81_02665 [SAR86 cluster bacterium]
MKTLMLTVFIFLLFVSLGFLGISAETTYAETGVSSILALFLSSLFTFLSYVKFESLEDDFLFLWVKTKTKRLKERKNSAKEAMRKELEDD